MISYKIFRNNVLAYTSKFSNKSNLIDVPLLVKINSSNYKFSTRNNYNNFDFYKLRNYNDYIAEEKDLAQKLSNMINTVFDYDTYLTENTYFDGEVLYFDTSIVKLTINYLLSMIYQEISIPLPLNLYKIINILDNTDNITFFGNSETTGREWANEIKESIYYTHIYNLNSFSKKDPEDVLVEFESFDIGYYIKKINIDLIEIMKKLNINYIENYNDNSFLIKNFININNKKDFKKLKNIE